MADSHSRSASEIEAEIAHERAALGDTLDEVNHRLSYDHLARQMTDGLRDNSGEIARVVSRAVKDNPMALALTGVGLAWMIFGSGPGNRPAVSHARDTGHDVDRSYRSGMSHGGATATGSVYGGTGAGSTGGYASTGGSSARDLYARNAGMQDHDDGPGFGDRISSMAGAVRDRISDTFGRARDTVSHGSSDMGDHATDAGRRMRSSASELRARMSHGLEDMSDAARERVIQAREAAVHARERAENMTAQGRERAAHLYDEQPFVAGALAMALGAAVAAMLPRTSYEDDAFGAQSDHLMDEAERIFSEERAKLGKVADAAMDEARDVADDAMQAARDSVPDADTAMHEAESRAKQAARRVADAARDEAGRQHLGSSAGADVAASGSGSGDKPGSKG